jgi:hypothetical protein
MTQDEGTENFDFNRETKSKIATETQSHRVTGNKESGINQKCQQILTLFVLNCSLCLRVSVAKPGLSSAC